MNVSLNGLQRNAVESFTELVNLIKKSRKTDHDDYIIDRWVLEKAIDSLRDDIIILACIIDPDTDKAFLDGDDGPKVPYLEIDENENDQKTGN
jgi:hypothetical protein